MCKVILFTCSPVQVAAPGLRPGEAAEQEEVELARRVLQPGGAEHRRVGVTRGDHLLSLLFISVSVSFPRSKMWPRSCVGLASI